MCRTLKNRQFVAAVAGLGLVLWWSATASAQLDPLLFLRRVPPTVIIAVDTSMRMLEDGNGRYYDPQTYSITADAPVSTALLLSASTTGNYRRVFQNLLFESVQDASTKFEATDIKAVPDSDPTYHTFWSNTRLEIAKSGIDRALSDYIGTSHRFGLVKMRQSSAAWRTGTDCDKPVRVTGNTKLATVADSTPCNAGSVGKFGVYVPKVSSNTPNYSIETSLGGNAAVVTPAGGAQSSIVTVVRRGINDAAGLIPAGTGTRGYADRPITHLLEDAKTVAATAMTNDAAATRSCRNSVIVLIAGGKDDGDASYTAAHNVESYASTFTAVSASSITKRIPIHVVAVRPPADHEAQLRAIAANSGGTYRNVSSAAGVAAAINYAVQSGFARQGDFDSAAASEFTPVSPVVGTVNIKNARSATGASLPNTDITANPGGQPLPQRSNILLTAGFALPGFDGVLRAFRTYVPVADTTKPTGWKFVSDGTRLWPDLDGRPGLAGKARVPADPNSRNIYTYIPNPAGGGGDVVAFTTANLPVLTTPMQTGDETANVIQFIRSQPIGAVIGSTPAIMDVPSLDPPPDDLYGRVGAAGSFADTYKDRRSLIFVGANDGMIHAIDTRTGYEVWAFIPYNLLPKLRTLVDGQSVEQFDFFVDSSPKIAEVKLSGQWRSMLIIGQGQGGTFYQAFDVTSAGMGVAPDRDDISAVNDLLSKFDTPNESIQFKWSFPNYANFDPTYTDEFTVTDGTPGGIVKLYGDLSSSASYAEKTVGFTWSDPAVGPLDQSRSTNAVIVGSGYFPDIEKLIPGRGTGAPQAGNALYLLDADTGLPLGNTSGSSCTQISSGSGSGAGCVSIGDISNNGRKNALQADPTAAGIASSLVVSKAYLGDIDGRYWRFDFTQTGTISATLMHDTNQPIYNSSALLFVGSVDVYMFFATGSDLLPANAPGGDGTFKLYGLKDNAIDAAVKFGLSLAAVTNSSGLASGERPSVAPSVAGDIVFYSTTTESASTPCSDYTAKLYAVTYVGSAAYDSNASGKIENNESPVVRTMAGRATAPFIVDQHLYIGTTSGAAGAPHIEAFGDPEDFNNGIGQVGVRILSWREIR